MQLVKVKTADLIGAPLDWAVARAEGFDRRLIEMHGPWKDRPECIVNDFFFRPSIDWKFGGPIIERERLHIGYCGDDNQSWPCQWFAQYDCEPENHHQVGSTPLIAAMRAFVASRFGETVEVPEIA